MVYVATVDEGVVGYYALCSGGVEREHVPENFGKVDPIRSLLSSWHVSQSIDVHGDEAWVLRSFAMPSRGHSLPARESALRLC